MYPFSMVIIISYLFISILYPQDASPKIFGPRCSAKEGPTLRSCRVRVGTFSHINGGFQKCGYP